MFFSPQTMHFYFDITLQFLIMKKDLKLDCYLLYMYTNVLEQVSINICKTLDWVTSPLFSYYLELFNQGCLNSSALHVLHWEYPKNKRNKTRLTLAPNSGCLGVL